MLLLSLLFLDCQSHQSSLIYVVMYHEKFIWFVQFTRENFMQFYARYCARHFRTWTRHTLHDTLTLERATLYTAFRDREAICHFVWRLYFGSTRQFQIRVKPEVKENGIIDRINIMEFAPILILRQGIFEYQVTRTRSDTLLIRYNIIVACRRYVILQKLCEIILISSRQNIYVFKL